MELMINGKKLPFTPAMPNIPPYEGQDMTLAKAKMFSHSAYISYMVLPIPSKEDLELDAFDNEVSEELKILGYIEE
jgi:hypothetical protein